MIEGWKMGLEGDGRVAGLEGEGTGTKWAMHPHNPTSICNLRAPRPNRRQVLRLRVLREVWDLALDRCVSQVLKIQSGRQKEYKVYVSCPMHFKMVS